MKKVFILGSSGSIGVNALNVIRAFPEKFRVTGLTVNTNINLLEKQIDEFKPEVVVVKDEQSAGNLRKKKKFKCEILSGEDGLKNAAVNGDYEIFLSALVGFAGLKPTIEAIKRSKRIALANKETLVAAGKIIKELCSVNSAELIPVDSEHSAIYQCLAGEKAESVYKLILTASGGPFLNKTKEEMRKVTVGEALSHPNWEMGNKITIDSASMMNKGLEVIEAHWLFELPKEKLEVVVHPQSVIHSMVEFIDGSIKAQLGLPDMKLPIQYALAYPERLRNSFPRTDFAKLKTFTFFKPDLEKFECLKLAYNALSAEGTAPCILNAANEIAVDKFLAEEITFSKIPEIIKEALQHIENHKDPDLETIYECDRATREFASKLN